MKLKYCFEFMELDDHYIAIPIGRDANLFQGTLKMNQSALEIFKMLDRDFSEAEVVSEMKRRYGDKPEVHDFVHEMIEYLISEGVLE